MFEAVGLAGQQGRRADPKVKERAPLVLPPDAKLPEPGKRAVVADDQQWPDDPDLKRAKQASLSELERKKYCSEVGKDVYHPEYNEKKAEQCGGLFSKALNNAFGRAPEPDAE